MLDSSSVCTIIQKNLIKYGSCASKIAIGRSRLLDKVHYLDKVQDFKTLSNDLIKIIGVINTAVKNNDWAAKDVKIIVAEDGHQPIKGLDPFPRLG